MREAILNFLGPFLPAADREPVLGDLSESYPRFSRGLVYDAVRIVLRQVARAWIESPLAMVFAIGAALAATVIVSRIGWPPRVFWTFGGMMGAAIEGGLPVAVAAWLSPRRPAAAPFSLVVGLQALFVSSIDWGHMGTAYGSMIAATYAGMYAGWRLGRGRIVKIRR